MRKIKKKKIDRKRLFYTLGFFIFCVIGLTVAYSALSTTLNISGSANVTQSSWSITLEKYPISDFYMEHFDMDVCSQNIVTCIDGYGFDGNASIEKVPTISGTTVKDFSVSVSIPGDSVIFFYKVTNNGTIPAKLESISLYTPTYTSSINNSNDILWAQNNVEFLFELSNYKENFNTLVEGDIVCPGDSKVLVMSLNISDGVTTIPTGPVTISNGGAEYIFTQADSNVCLN